MKRILLLLSMAFAMSMQAQQPYNNEWIDYSKTYYKFKVGVTGLYRINQPLLASLGLNSINADHFQLWRNGQQIPIYTSVQGAPLGSSDYIEFWGEANDGKADKDLYRLPDYQMNDKWSLETDTAAFFLTVNTSGGNLHLLPTANNLSGNTLSPEPFFIYTTGKYFRDKINGGRSELVGSSYTYSSSYDYGEGWSSSDIGSNSSATVGFPNLKAYTGAGAPEPVVKVNASGNAVNTRTLTIKINSDSVYGQPLNYYDYVKVSKTISIAQLSIASPSVRVSNVTTAPNDRMVVAQIELTYPRQFDFGGASNFSFELPANTSGNYLQISGVTYGSVAPVLYDLTNGKRYVVDISNPSLLKVVLLPSAVNRKLILVSQAATNIATIGALQQRNFVNYGLAANQGDYLLITSSILTGAAAGGDPVDDYRVYRSSSAGGSFNAKVYLVDELIDQFGFGIKKHPLSVRNFLRWARATYSNPLKYVLLVGKGVTYTQHRSNESNPDIEKLDLIPTFGEPASDNLLSAAGSSSVPLTPIGRLSVIAKNEISDYLDKVKQYEQEQTVSSPLISDVLWKKNVVHITGASDDVTSDILLAALNGHKRIIEDTFYGGKVYTFTKNSSSTVEQLASNQLASLINGGVGLLTYFGHSSSTTLEFNLDNPQNYSNEGKYPVFIVMGCNAGNFYNFNIARFTTKETISERYLLAKERGSIAFLASTHLGIVHYLDIYNSQTYKSASYSKYGGSLGQIMDDAIAKVFSITTENDFYARFQCEQFTMHGDPAIHLYSFEKPDYVIEEPLVKVSPSFITVGDLNFKVNAKFVNTGKAPDKDIVVTMKRVFPDLSEEITRDTISGVLNTDSLIYTLEIHDPLRDKGLNKITITVDADNDVDELYETNNSVTKEVYIFEDEVRPVYPYNFSIVKEQNPTLIASTANAFAETRSYKMEVDTTELFNSPLKISRTTTSPGGIIEFTPGITFTDSTVYYWRVSPDVPNTDPNWNVSSFIFIDGVSDGFGQAHFFQHFKSQSQRIVLDSATRKWNFGKKLNNIFVRNGVYPQTSTQGGFYTGTINDQLGFIGPGCAYDELIFNVIDSVTFKAWKNVYSGGAGLFQSKNSCGAGREYNFMYAVSDTTWRRKAMNFIDLIPPGDFVVVRNNGSPTSNTYASVWKNDQNTMGPGNSLYHKLYNQGFTDLDSFNRPRSFIFIFQKDRYTGNGYTGPTAFTPKWIFSDGIYDGITLNADCYSPDTLGYITSPLFGPAKAWHQLTWKGGTVDNQPGDVASIDVIGVNNAGVQTTLFSNITATTFDISSIQAADFPYIKLRMRNQDSLNFTPYQLKYWLVTHDPVPEGAVAPNLYFSTKDTVEVGEPLNLGLAFKNISKIAFDSVLVKLTITGQDNVDHNYTVRNKDLPPGDTVRLNIPIETAGLSGHNTMFLNFNPEYDQPEQYLFNNYIFRNLYVRPDSLHPVLDVTFDGTHILNRDIVSPKPAILVKLTDEAKWMVLDDTSLLTVNVRYPDGNLRRFYFGNNDTMQFIPAGQAPNENNAASINFKPYFFQDGEYELIITGKDRSENTAGTIQYRVLFQVYNKAMISNMLNYPNPFTTSTAFVFTITGSEIPQNIRIQVLTITGKVVREITKDELGPLHIGRNITEFKWDGTDQYGQKLANGIYLYRVITNLNGKSLDKFKNPGEDTDKFFNNGYGKMYLMR